MPGQMLAEFNNELRYSPRPGIRVIDVLLDVILPELAGQGVPSALLDAELVERVVAGSYFDDEAEFVLSQTRDNRLPVTPFPTGGELRDVTWAFNQATGARPERWEVNEALAAGQGGVFDPELGRFRRPRDGEIATVVLDPLTGEPVYPINEALPSLQRLPGIIFVPAGLFPICGTITLFGGQQLVGVSASGSVLLKYGDGPCVRTQHPANLVDDRHMTAERAARTRLTPGEEGRGRIDAILRRFDEDWRAEVAGGDEAPEAHFAQTAWWSAGPDVRREVVERQLVSTEFTGYASVRVASLAIEQRDWRSGVATLEARLPVEDELADPRAPVGFFDEAEGLRVGPLLHSSVGVDLVGCGFSVPGEMRRDV